MSVLELFIGYIEKQKPGLTLKRVVVHRGGKSFSRWQWVREPGAEIPEVGTLSYRYWFSGLPHKKQKEELVRRKIKP